MSAEDRILPSLPGLAVLLVDDNQNMRRLLHTLLRAMRITAIRDAASGKDALTLLRDFTPDVIITDLAMKPINGIDFVRVLRTDRNSPAPDVPVVMLTGHTDQSIVMRARDAGINDFVVKPVSAKQLAERLVRLVGSKVDTTAP